MKSRDTLGARFARGALAGLAGNMALQAAQTVRQNWLPRANPPIQGDPAAFMVEKLEHALPARFRRKVPRQVEDAVAASLPVGYGVTFGSLYGAVRPRGGNVVLDGVGLGVASWAAGFLGWLPATGLMPPVSKHQSKQVAASLIEHAIYGIAVVATYDCLRRNL
ncbi:MAG: hypothetical protein JWR69_3099 [Pedosphaera sp.]|nr:hypothetical protein [Pedosphaera sp.]